MMGNPTVLVKPELDLYFLHILEYSLVFEYQSILLSKCVIACQHMNDSEKVLKFSFWWIFFKSKNSGLHYLVTF